MLSLSKHAGHAAIIRRNPRFSPRRVGAMVLRHWYVLRGSWPRIVELAYWPTVQMVLWGFMTQFLVGQTSYFAQAFGVLLSGVLLWDVLFRGQLGVSISFFEEIWARNLGHLFVSPLRPYEMVFSLGAMSLIRTVIGVVPAAVMATIFFGFNVASLGISLAAFFFLLLVLGWALGLAICGIVMRYGQGAESLAWAAIFAVAPVSGIYYPISVLPHWLQAVAHALPSAYVFEGMRAILTRHEVRIDLLVSAALLDAVYLAVGIAAFLAYFRMARRRGLLLQQGE
jgi:ABC-2 type transport system permease protein